MTIPAQRWLTLEFSLFPNEFIVGIQHDEVVNVGRGNEVLLTSGSRVDAPASEEYDVWSTNVSGMSVSW